MGLILIIVIIVVVIVIFGGCLCFLNFLGSCRRERRDQPVEFVIPKPSFRLDPDQKSFIRWKPSGLSTPVAPQIPDEQLQYIKDTEKKMIELRNIQEQLMERPTTTPKFPLLICVDARPKQIGGYCIDFFEKICYCYTYKADVLPWELMDKTRQGDSAEFEMKNLLFALLLWEDKIKASKQVQIHTDNSAINQNANTYGLRASSFLYHLMTCEAVKVNEDIHLNIKKNPDDFAKYITPADDLSRWEIGECQQFLTAIHGISKFEKSHEAALQARKQNIPNKPHYKPTWNYEANIKKVNQSIKYWKRNPCLNCGFMVDDTASLRSMTSVYLVE